MARLSSTRRVIESPRRDAALAGALFDCSVLLYLAGLYNLDLGRPVEVPLWRLGLLAKACVIMLLRRRRPVLALVLATPVVAADLAAGFSFTTALVVGDLLYCAALYSSRRFSRAMVWMAVATDRHLACLAGDGAGLAGRDPAHPPGDCLAGDPGGMGA